MSTAAASAPSSPSSPSSAVLWAVLLVMAVVLGGPVGCGDDELSLEQISQLQSAGRHEESIEALRKLIDQGDRSSETMLLYGIGLTKAGLHSQALWPLKEAQRDPEYFVRATMHLASGNYVTGNHDIAIEQLSELLEKEPENIAALKMRAFARLHTRRDYEGALEDSERSLDLEPENQEMIAPRIVALLGLKRVDDAREAIEEFAEQEVVPEDEESETPASIRALACVGRAKFYQEDEKLEEATEQFALCADAFPSQTIAVHEAMEYFQERKDYEKFDEILRAAYEASPGDRSFRIALARRQQLLGNTDEAKQILTDAVDAGYTSAMLDLAGFLVDAGDIDGAVETYEKAEELGATGPRYILSYGEVLIKAGRYDQALKVADGPGPESHKVFIRGRAALAKGDYEQALEHLTRGVQLWPDNAVARYYTAVAAEQTGDVDRAIEEHRNAMRIDAAAADSRRRLGRLHLEEGNPQAALYVLRYQTQAIEPLRSDMELVLLELEAIGAAGELERIPPALVNQVTYPGVWGSAVAALARGVERREGPKGAVAMIEVADRLDLKKTNAAPALREYVRYLAALGRTDDALTHARVAAKANPESPINQVILGEALLLNNDLSAASDAFGRALTQAPKSPDALAGAGRVAMAQGKLDKAIEFFERVEGEEVASRIRLAQAEALAQAGRKDEAEALLEVALASEPSSGDLAVALARYKLARSADSEAGRALALRGQRLGAAAEASALLGTEGDSASGAATSGTAADKPTG